MHKQVNTAEEAVATCATQKYDLIVMDMDSQWPVHQAPPSSLQR